MIKNFSKVVITNCVDREKEGLVMKRLLERKSENISVSISFDPVRWGAWKTLKNALETPCNSDWLITMQDDLSFPVDILQRIDYILGFFPKDSFVFFYVPTNGNMIEAHKSNKHVLKSKYNFWPQCVAWPRNGREDFLKTIPLLWHEDSTGDDSRMKKYFHYAGIYTFTIIPSLINHLGVWRSSLGYSGRVGKYERNTFCYEPDFDVTKIDWAQEIENPFICKMAKGLLGFEDWKYGQPMTDYNDGGFKKTTK